MFKSRKHRKQEEGMGLIKILRHVFARLESVEAITEQCTQGSNNQVCTVT